MYAIIQHGGHQYRVSSGDRLVVDRLPDDVGAVIGLEPVLLVSDADGVRTGDASLEGVRVAATVVSHTRGKKLRILTYKPKKRHRKTLGFRADLTELKVEGVLARGEALPASLVVVEEPEAPLEEAPAAAAKPARGRRPVAAVIVEAALAVEEPEAPEEEAPKLAAKPARSRRAAPAAAEAAPTVEDTAPATAAAAKPARTRRAAPAATVQPAAEETAPEAPAKPARSRRVAKGAAEASDPEV
jgi:large subunit ribosomal protein L21